VVGVLVMTCLGPLFCTSLPTAPSNYTSGFDGFTDEQNSNVFALATQLAEGDGL
jgi:hypothetical protein